jgi:hypothetical protein
VTSVTLLPGYAGNSNVAGNAGTSAPGFPTGSWQAPGTAQKSESYIPASALFSGPVTLNDIASISYWTNKATTAADVDWTFLIYTAKTNSGDTGSFYHTRLNSEPYFSSTPVVPANTWHQWSSNDPNNPMRFYDAARSGTFGTYGDPTLAQLQAGPITWGNNTQYDYRTSADTISLFSLQTGSAWANGFTGLVDGLTITLTNGDVGIVNLEAVPVPLPAAAWAGLTLIGGVGGLKGVRRFRRAQD